MCSWALLNRPSTTAATTPPRPVPTLVQIQETLVTVGDKEQSFINSREWIGCYEASIVLDQLYEVRTVVTLEKWQLRTYNFGGSNRVKYFILV